MRLLTQRIDLRTDTDIAAVESGCLGLWDASLNHLRFIPISAFG